MKIYTVYLKKNSNPLMDAEYIPEGFSWMAFIFNFFWLIYQKLWLQGALFLIAYIIINEFATSELISPMIESIVYFGICFYIGFGGNDMIRKKLENTGYTFNDVVVAKSMDEAEYKFIEMLIKHQNEITS